MAVFMRCTTRKPVGHRRTVATFCCPVPMTAHRLPFYCLVAAVHICDLCFSQAYQELLASREALSAELQDARVQLEQSANEVRIMGTNSSLDLLLIRACTSPQPLAWSAHLILSLQPLACPPVVTPTASLARYRNPQKNCKGWGVCVPCNI